MRTRLYQAKTTYFCGGVLVDEHDTIIKVPPILHWAKGKQLQTLWYWIKKKGGNLTGPLGEEVIE